MCWLPKKCFCFSLRSGTISQGLTFWMIGLINMLVVLLGLTDYLKGRIYYLCWPSEECYLKTQSLEKTVVLANVVFNSLFIIFGSLLLVGVKNNRPNFLLPYTFVYGLVISGLIGSAATAIVICFNAGFLGECTSIFFMSSLYIAINIYMALVVSAYYCEMKQMKAAEVALVGKKDFQFHSVKLELTLEDYVF